MKDAEKGRVGVLKGGPSEEREVSLSSGAAVARGLLQAGYEVLEIDVRDHQPAIPADLDAVFIALHGAFGEDGEIQALLEEAGMPYTGPGPDASRKAFDKRITKQLLGEHGIPTPPFEVLEEGQDRSLPLPVVVKPPLQGSSIGLCRVFREEEWLEGARQAFGFGNQILVEAFIPGRELTVSVLGEEVLPVVEICAPDGRFDYKAKYTKGITEYVVPAPLSSALQAACEEYAMKAYQVIGCRGMSRIDFRLSPEDELFVLEVNTIPGFTETSLLPMAAAAAGIEFPALCDRLIQMAMLRSK